MATLGLCCCAKPFSSFGIRGLIVMASLVVEHGAVGHMGFSSCGAQSQLPCSMWNPP